MVPAITLQADSISNDPPFRMRTVQRGAVGRYSWENTILGQTTVEQVERAAQDREGRVDQHDLEPLDRLARVVEIRDAASGRHDRRMAWILGGLIAVLATLLLAAIQVRHIDVNATVGAAQLEFTTGAAAQPFVGVTKNANVSPEGEAGP